MELPELIAILRRRWWLVLLAPVIVAGLLVWQGRTRPYQVSLRATILIPGDTEIPGNSERPELMVLDDLPPLVRSHAFAEGVHAEIPGTALTVEDVASSLNATRYSRVLTVVVTRGHAGEATEIAQAVQRTLPDLINRYLIPVGGAPATVNVIDPPGDPTRSRPNDGLKAAVLLLAALVAGGGLALLVDLADPRSRARREVERGMAAPVPIRPRRVQYGRKIRRPRPSRK